MNQKLAIDNTLTRILVHASSAEWVLDSCALLGHVGKDLLIGNERGKVAGDVIAESLRGSETLRSAEGVKHGLPVKFGVKKFWIDDGVSEGIIGSESNSALWKPQSQLSTLTLSYQYSREVGETTTLMIEK